MRELIRTFKECVCVAIAGLALGLAANAENPIGLELTTDYFARSSRAATRSAVNARSTTPGPTTRPAVDPDPGAGSDAASGDDEQAIAEAVRSHFTALGLQVAEHDDVVADYHNPFHLEDQTFIFVDARKEVFYREGHIPRAFNLYHFRKDRTLDAVLAACAAAEKVIVYCNGGDCEDSEYTAEDLIASGVDPGKVYVYVDGMTRWRAENLPLEKGERDSGEIINDQNVVDTENGSDVSEFTPGGAR